MLKNTLSLPWTTKKILLGGDVEIMQSRARDSFKNSFSNTSLFCICRSLLSSHQTLVLMLQWCQAGDAVKRREGSLRRGNSVHLWLSVANSFSPGLQDKWFNNPECCALCFGKVDSLHSALPTGISSNLLGKCWTNGDRGLEARGWPCIVCFLL